MTPAGSPNDLFGPSGPPEKRIRKRKVKTIRRKHETVKKKSPRDTHFGHKIGPNREPDCARMHVITLLSKKHYFFIVFYEGIALVANIIPFPEFVASGAMELQLAQHNIIICKLITLRPQGSKRLRAVIPMMVVGLALFGIRYKVIVETSQ